MLTLKVSPRPFVKGVLHRRDREGLVPSVGIGEGKGPALRRVVAPSHSRPVGSAVGDGQVRSRCDATRTQRHGVVGCGITLIYTSWGR